jgi:uncharacterized YigZ family protein
MMNPEYKTIKEPGVYESVVKKSRFISNAVSVSDEESAKQFIHEIKEKFRDASHNTYAYVVGKGTRTERYSDDGEPGGTAGIPILEKIRHFGLTDTVVVVTRYFGGTLLGTGGLARAYSSGAEEVILKCGISGFIKGYLVSIATDYHYLGKVQNCIQGNGCRVVDENFTDHVIIRTLIPVQEYEKVKNQITEITNARALIDVVEEEYIEMES